MRLYVDIETIPDQSEDAKERARLNTKAPSNYKKPEAIEKYIVEHADETHAKTALNGLYGEICSIAWACDDGAISSVVRDSTTSEAKVLAAFFEGIETSAIRLIKTPNNDAAIYPNMQAIQWIGHNIIDFDTRFLKQRCLINRIRSKIDIPADAKHGHNSAIFDTMKEWAGWKGYVKQDELYSALGGPPYANDDIDGSMVGTLWASGEYKLIKQYNEHDVEKLRFIHRVMTGHL